MIRLLALFSALCLLAACLSPREQCVANVTRDLTTLRALISETEQNINRGFARKQVTVTQPVFTICAAPNGKTVPCFDTVEQTQPRAEAIDLNAEQRKLDSMRAKERVLNQQAQRDILACQVAHPAS